MYVYTSASSRRRGTDATQHGVRLQPTPEISRLLEGCGRSRAYFTDAGASSFATRR